jgi:uncharacterized membrane protein YidH (DUF202 family)
MVFDPGLQPERTALSWNRTSLSMVVGGIAGLKVLPDLIGGWGLAVAVAVIAAGGGLGLAAHRRSERGHAVLLGGEGLLPDGRVLVMVAVLIGLIGAVAFGTVVHAAVLR